MISATLIILAVFCFLLFLRVFAPDNNSIDRTYSAQVDYVRIYKTTVYTKENVENRYGTLAGLANVNTDKALFRYSAMPVPGFSLFRTEPDPWLENKVLRSTGAFQLIISFILLAVFAAVLFLKLKRISVKKPIDTEALSI